MKKYKVTPHYCTTTYAMVNDIEEFLAAGCSHYLSKPFSKRELFELPENILKQF